MSTVEDFIGSGGAPVAKFPTIGTTVKGVIQNIVAQPATDMDGNPKLTRAGRPMTDWVITLATDERDPEIDGDDGTRRIYANWRQQVAIKEAWKQAKATGEVVGGMLAVQYKEDGEATGGLTAPKLYVAQYKAPEGNAASVTADELI